MPPKRLLVDNLSSQASQPKLDTFFKPPTKKRQTENDASESTVSR